MNVKSVLIFLFVFIVITGCKDDDTVVEPGEENTDYIVEKATYVLETISDSFFGENNDGFYNLISFTVEMNNSVNPDNIKKIILFSEDRKSGWEFNKEELKELLSEDGTTFNFEHLKYNPFTQIDRDSKFSITLYDNRNEIIDNYDLLVNLQFPPYVRAKYNWYDRNSIKFEYSYYYNYYNIFCDSIKAIFENNGEKISEVLLDSEGSDLIPGVPDLASNFYLEFYFNSDNIPKVSVSTFFSLADGIPESAVLLPEGLTPTFWFMNNEDKNLILVDTSIASLYYWNIEAKSMSKEISLPFKPVLAKYYDDIIYLTNSTGAIYKSGDDGETTLVTSVGGRVADFIVIDKFIIITSYDRELWTFNLENGSSYNNENYSFYIIGGLVYNPSVHNIYGISLTTIPEDIFSMQYSPETGSVLNVRDSPYHGDYSLGSELYLLQGNDKILNSGGTIFNCSQNYSQDMQYFGSFETSFTDMVFNNDYAVCVVSNYNENYGLDSPGILQVYDVNNLTIKKSVELYEHPVAIYIIENEYLIMSQISTSNRFFVQVFDKNEIEAETLGKLNKKYYTASF